MNEKLNINQWAEEDRPREKLMQHGPAALSNAELLAILIGSGNAEETAVKRRQLAQIKIYAKRPARFRAGHFVFRM